jgi:hypothetical protein
MKKEIDTFHIERLIEVFEHALLWGWYLSGAIVAVCLWFFQVPDSKIQAFFFAGVFIWYTILSVSITKVGQIKIELK